ncbi:MAG: recombinase family protein [Candidatus Omnitrophota bacterium]
MKNKEIIRPCAIYVRVSTQMQADVGLSIETQIDTLKKEAERRGKPVYGIYADVKSGGTFKRPEFSRLLKDSQLKPSPFDLVLTWSVSRFGRNTMESYIATEKLRDRGVSIFYYKEPFDTEDSLGKLIIEILRAVAEFSRLEYVKDVERSKTHLAKCGYSTGGPPPFGFRRAEVNDNGHKRVKWEPDPVAAPLARRIFEMYSDGKGFKLICQWLNDNNISTTRGGKWAAPSFTRMLRNEIYIGHIVYNKEERKGVKNGNLRNQKDKDKWIRVENAVPPVVPTAVFDRVQKRLAEKGRAMAQCNNSQYLLSGLIKCNVCGLAYFGRSPKHKSNGKTYILSQYICSKQNRYNEKRDNVNLRREWFDELIVDRLFNRILTETNIKEKVRNVKESMEGAVAERKTAIRKLSEKKKRIEEGMEKYYEAFEQGALNPADLERRIKAQRENLEEIDVEIVNLKNEMLLCEVRQDNDAETLLDVDIVRLKELFDLLPTEKKKQFMKALIVKIVVDPSWFEIHYSLPTGFDIERIINENGPDDGGNGNGKNGSAGGGDGADYLNEIKYNFSTCKSQHLSKKPGAKAGSDGLLHEPGEETALHPKISVVSKKRANNGLFLIKGEGGKKESRRHLCVNDINGEGGIRTHDEL